MLLPTDMSKLKVFKEYKKACDTAGLVLQQITFSVPLAETVAIHMCNEALHWSLWYLPKDVAQHHNENDNCCGQKQNNALTQYLAWRTVVTPHKTIQISFMIPRHTKFAPDRFFGEFKKKFQMSRKCFFGGIFCFLFCFFLFCFFCFFDLFCFLAFFLFGFLFFCFGSYRTSEQ